MKKIVSILVIVSMGVLSIAQSSSIQKVSAAEVKTLIDKSSGPTIINFWASWCGPCIREIPYMEQQVAALATPVKLILVSLDFPSSYPTQLTGFVKKKGYKSEIVYLADTDVAVFTPLIDKQWTGAIPASIFIDNKKGYYQFFNSQLTEARLQKELANLLK